MTSKPSLKEIREQRAAEARREWFGPVALAALLRGAARREKGKRAGAKAA